MFTSEQVVNEPTSETNAPIFSSPELKKARRFIENSLKRSRKTTFAEVVEITPEMASLLLQRNPEDENRKLSKATVQKYADDMESGRWQGLNGQSIVLSADGRLNDGQHRLNAIIQVGVPVRMMVVFGASRDSRLTLDQNKIRTNGDYLHMQGIPYATSVAAIAKIGLGRERGAMSFVRGNSDKVTKRPTKVEVHEFAEQHLESILYSIAATGSNNQTEFSHNSWFQAAHWLITQQVSDAAPVDAFFTSLRTGEGLRSGDPELTVRRRLIQERHNGISCGYFIEAILRGWNAYHRGEKLSRLILRGNLPAIEG